MTTWTPKQVADLTARVNMKLRERQVETRDNWNISPVVAEVAPGWEWREKSAFRDRFAKVILTVYDPDSPL